MSCFYCKGKTVAGTTVYAVQYGNNVIVIKNVPCEECTQCGETEISDDVMRRLEELVAVAKQLMQEFAVIDYEAAA